MDFGKLPTVDRVQFRLPPPDPRTGEVLSHSPKTELQARLGAPVWGQAGWRGKIYPPKAQPRDFLQHYARQFDAIELNTTFYRVPDPKTIRAWKEAVSPRFRFCPKIPQQISHIQALQGTELETRRFCESLLGLGENLGPSFLQLPPQFSPQSLPLLERFLRALPGGFEIAVEFRHEAFFRQGFLIPPAFHLLRRYRAGAVITDVAGRRDVLHSSLPTPMAFVRFVGNELHPSDFTRIQDWVERLRQWIGLGLSRLYFFVHQPGDLTVPELTEYLAGLLDTRCGLRLKLPSGPPSESQMDFFQ